MLILGIISTVVWLAIVPVHSLSGGSNTFPYIRMSAFIFVLSFFLGISDLFLGFHSVEIYHTLFNYSSFTIIIDSLLYVVAFLVLVCFSPSFSGSLVKQEYGLILMFSILGASMIISAQDFISIYVALELQSFGLYLLACMRTDQTGSTHASLKYFLLGAISSAFVLLGISLIYQEVGSTGFQNISSFQQRSSVISLGLLSMLCGFMFKISAAPFHSWFSDVIQGVPTYTSIVIINLPKISIFTFLYVVLYFVFDGEVQGFVVITTIFSLVLGTVAGLVQTKIKRLLAFSTISHVGFILIGLCTGSEASLSAIVFYLVQYTFTVVLTFLALVAYENGRTITNRVEDPYIVDLRESQNQNQSKLLTFTFVLCLFSMAGIPPLTGFYAKLEVLNSSILQNMSIVFITAIVCSVISAAYYFKVIKVLMFDQNQKRSTVNNRSGQSLMSPLHSYTMALLTAFICLFILDPQPILNCTELVALSLYLVLWHSL